MQKYKTIKGFLNDLSKDKRLQVDALRTLIMKTEPNLEEHIKWNAPSYVLDGEDRIAFTTIEDINSNLTLPKKSLRIGPFNSVKNLINK